MTTEKHENKEIQPDKSRKPAEVSGESVIDKTSNQDRWKAIEQGHFLDQDESATHVLFKTGGGNKFGIDDETPKLAYDMKDLKADFEKAWVQVGEPLVAKTDEGIDKLFGGSVNIKASEDAYDAFPKLSEYGLPRRIVAALILNEVRHKKPKDPVEDAEIGLLGKVVDLRNGFKENPDASIGPGQIQVRNVTDLAGRYEQLKKLPDPVKAAIEPSKAPYFVAAYLTDRIKSLETYNTWHDVKVPINAGTLFYLYNPDVVVREGKTNPSADDFRALTALEKIERSATGKRPESVAGWVAVMMPTHQSVIGKSSIVREMQSALKAVESEH